MNINYNTVVDLSHVVRPGAPIWPGDPAIVLSPEAVPERDGYSLQRLTIGEHSGTHCGVAAHFTPGDVTMDRLDPAGLVRQAIVIDVAPQVEDNPRYILDIDAIEHWERSHGRVPEGSAVLLHTGWSGRWDDPAAYLGQDAGATEAMRTPGYGLDAARFLAGERGVVGLGIDTHGIDSGADTEFSVNAFWLRGERFHLENLTNLHRLPAVGITLFIGALKIAEGSGAPARVLALF